MSVYRSPKELNISLKRILAGTTPLMMGGLALFIFGAVSAQSSSQYRGEEVASADVAAIQGIINEFIDAYNSGDANRMKDTYSADLVYMFQGGPTAEGKDARESTVQYLRDTFSKYSGHLVVHVDELKVYGSIAFDRGAVEVTLTPKAGGDVRAFNRRFLEIWRKEGDGKWRVIRAMNNTDK